MKSLRNSFLLTAMLTVTAATMTADENTPMVTDGVMDLEKYLFGDVDSNGQTILHRIVANCDNDDFTVRLKPFDFVDNCEKSENFKLLQVKMAMCNAMSKDVAQAFVMLEMNNFVQKRDNNGETALDIAKKRNALNPHTRCASCVELLNIFDELNKGLKK